MTLVAVITQAVGRYCLESLSPAFAHVWVRFTPPKLKAHLLIVLGHGHRRRLRIGSDVLSHPILHPAQTRPLSAQSISQSRRD